MKRALVLSGGGAKGAFQVGVVERLFELGLRFHFVSGVSVGALNASMIAQGRFDDLKRIWLRIRNRKAVYGKRILGIVSPLFGSSSLYHQKPLQKLIRAYVDPLRLRKTGIELRVGMVDLVTGRYVSADQYHPFIHDCILASTAIPLAFPPAKIGKAEHPMVDGGVRNISPLGEAIDCGAKEIHVVLCNPSTLGEEEKNYKNALNIVLRSLDILLDEIVRNDIEICQLKNRISDNYRHIKLFVYAPDRHLYSTLEFTPDAIREAMNMGSAVAERTYHAGS